MNDDNPLDFEAIRPYEDEEVPAVLQAISERSMFGPLMSYLYPDVPLEEIAARLRQVHTVEEFQHTYISRAMQSIVRDSITELTEEGLAELDPKQGYLFLSNHRDIILDSGLLNLLRYQLGHPTTYIAIGDNLMITPMVTDLMKLNKSFVVHRTPPRAEMYAYSDRLSRYIRALITQGHSVWLAQRNGRTKDGRDQTQPALLKMLSISASTQHDRSEAMLALNLVPMAISYEYEPCDYLKAEEMVRRATGQPYRKNDRDAIIRGIREPKGRVHVAVGKPLQPQDLAPLASLANRNDWLRELGQLIDQHIHRLYRRWPLQYAACDLLHGGDAWADHYHLQTREAFVAYVEQRIADLPDNKEALRQVMYQIYAGMIAEA